MSPKLSSAADARKSVLVVPSRVISRPDALKGGEETEIAAQISVPEEGGWGWVVVVASFYNIMILDGVCFTYGSLIEDIKKDFGITDSQGALVNSIAVAQYFLLGPLASACINRFGFRLCCMTGSVIVSCALLCSYFTTNYSSLCFFYGGIAGIGYCFLNLSSSLVVGFYFEKLRALALSIALTGSSCGIAIISPVNTFLVNIAGWRVTTLIHTGLFGLIYFSAMTYRPLLALTIIKTNDDPTRTVTYLPNVASVTPSSNSHSRTAIEGALMPTATERLFSAVSNLNFPTAASVVEEGLSSRQPGPSTAAAVSKLTLTAHSPHGGLSTRQLKQVKSILSRSKLNVQDGTNKNVEVTINVDEPKKRNCWQRLCHWEEHVTESRPMYRDDAFYGGKLEKLPEYQKSMMDAPDKAKTGLEYQMAVSRAITAVDLQEKRGVFTTAARRVLVTMVDPKLLNKNSFLILSCGGFTVFLGYLVPYVFIKDRNKLAGIDITHCNWFVSVIGIANAIGRLAIAALVNKYDPLNLYVIVCLVSGLTTILSTLTYNIFYQYAYCIIFGFFISSFTSLRSLAVVSLYGLDKLTNATGILLLFQGIGSLISTPLAGIIKERYGYDTSFYVAGACMLVAGIISVPIKKLAEREKRREHTTKNVIHTVKR